MERDDSGWFEYTFGMNDESGRLLQIIVPARSEADARELVNKMFYLDRWSYWSNDVHPY